MVGADRELQAPLATEYYGVWALNDRPIQEDGSMTVAWVFD